MGNNCMPIVIGVVAAIIHVVPACFFVMALLWKNKNREEFQQLSWFTFAYVLGCFGTFSYSLYVYQNG